MEKGVTWLENKRRYKLALSVRQGIGKKSKQTPLGAGWKTANDANKASLAARAWLKKHEHTITEDNYKVKLDELKRVAKNTN